MKKVVWLIGVILLIVSFLLDSYIISFAAALRTDSVVSFMLFITSIGFVFILLASYSFLLRSPKKVFLLALSVILAYIIGFGLKLLFLRERPDLGLIEELTFSFPSNHAAIAFSTLPIMIRSFPKYTYLFFFISTLIAFSRVYLGVHYASDLIFGGFLGYGIGLIVINWENIKKWKISGKRN